MYDLVCIGDITVDLYFKGASLTTEKSRFSLAMGGKYLADAFHQGLGGNAANVAIDGASLDLDTALCALVGENVFKQIIIQHLVKKNVSTELLLFIPDFINISAILLDQTGEKTVIHYPSPAVSFTFSQHILTQLQDAKAYFIAHIPQATLKEKIDLIVHMSSFKKPIFLNLGASDFKHSLSELKPYLALADTLFLNTHEFCELTKKEYDAVDFKTNVAPMIAFEDKLLVLTDGGNGSFAYHNNQVYHQKAKQVEKIIDTTGVGDAYAASFIASCMREPNIPLAMMQATEFAAKKLSKLGAN